MGEAQPHHAQVRNRRWYMTTIRAKLGYFLIQRPRHAHDLGNPPGYGPFHPLGRGAYPGVSWPSARAATWHHVGWQLPRRRPLRPGLGPLKLTGQPQQRRFITVTGSDLHANRKPVVAPM